MVSSTDMSGSSVVEEIEIWTMFPGSSVEEANEGIGVGHEFVCTGEYRGGGEGKSVT